MALLSQSNRFGTPSTQNVKKATPAQLDSRPSTAQEDKKVSQYYASSFFGRTGNRPAQEFHRMGLTEYVIDCEMKVGKKKFVGVNISYIGEVVSETPIVTQRPTVTQTVEGLNKQVKQLTEQMTKLQKANTNLTALNTQQRVELPQIRQDLARLYQMLASLYQ